MRSSLSLILGFFAFAVLTLHASAQKSKPDSKWSIEEIHGLAVPFDITVDEGAGMSVDVSPDGQTIIFNLLGDLYTTRITGDIAKRITSGPAYDVQLRFHWTGNISYSSQIEMALIVSERLAKQTPAKAGVQAAASVDWYDGQARKNL